MNRLEKLYSLKKKIDREIDLLEETFMSIRDIIDFACNWFDVSYYELVSECRKRELTDVRAMLANELRKRMHTYESIGKALNRTHATVINMKTKHDDFVSFDEEFKIKSNLFAIILRKTEKETWIK